MERTIREICLICKGERWLPDPADPARSRPCPHCGGQGWVDIDPRSLGEAPAPEAADQTKKSPKT
jgi:hypothetical protein